MAEWKLKQTNNVKVDNWQTTGRTASDFLKEDAVKEKISRINNESYLKGVNNAYSWLKNPLLDDGSEEYKADRRRNKRKVDNYVKDLKGVYDYLDDNGKATVDNQISALTDLTPTKKFEKITGNSGAKEFATTKIATTLNLEKSIAEKRAKAVAIPQVKLVDEYAKLKEAKKDDRTLGQKALDTIAGVTYNRDAKNTAQSRFDEYARQYLAAKKLSANEIEERLKILNANSVNGKFKNTGITTIPDESGLRPPTDLERYKYKDLFDMSPSELEAEYAALEAVTSVDATAKDYADYVGKSAASGAVRLVTGVAATGETLVGTPIKAVINLFGGDSSFLDTKETRDAWNEKFTSVAQEAGAKVGDRNYIAGNLVENVVRYIPSMVLAFATGGASEVPNLASSGSAVADIISQFAKSPIFWSTFAETFGEDVESAMEKTDNPTLALISGLSASILKSAIEIGGVESIPSKFSVASSGIDKAVDLFVSALEEGGEEILQGGVDTLFNYVLLGEKPDTENLLQNTANEAVMGFLGGLILGGGTTTIESIINAKTINQYREIGKKVIDSEIPIDSLVNYANTSENVALKEMVASADINDKNTVGVGQIYAEICRDISSNIKVANINTAVQNAKTMVVNNGANSPIVTGIVMPQLIERINGIGNKNKFRVITDVLSTPIIETAEQTQTVTTGPASEESIFPEDNVEIKNDAVADVVLNRKANAKEVSRQEVVNVAQKLGWNVVYENIYVRDDNGNIVRDNKGRVVRGNAYVDSANRTIHIDPTNKKYAALFKHELSDSCTREIGKFRDVINSVFDALKTKEFMWYLRSKGVNSTQDLINSTIETRLNAGDTNFTSVADDRNALEFQAQIEITSDFIGEVCFGGETALDDLLAKLEQNKNVFQRFIDLLRNLLNNIIVKIKGTPQEKTVRNIENKLAKAYAAAEKTENKVNRARNSVGVDNVIDLSDETELKEITKNLKGAKKYSAVQQYILDKIGNDFTFSDGLNVVVDRRDALHIANKSADKKTAEISAIEKLIKSAVIYADETNVDHPKFDYFAYYQTFVKYGNDTFPIYLNIGKGKNDAKYHLYDITHKLRDTARRINGVERLREFRSANGISTDIISTPEQKSQEKFSSDTASMTTERIDYLIEDSGAGNRTDYAQAWITSINPTDFLNMTLGTKNQNREVFDTLPGDYGSTVNDYDYVEDGLKKEKRQTPYLAVNYETGEVVGHEGRHRMRALEKNGITSAEIKIEFRDADGRLIKELNGYGNPLETIDTMEIFNERGTGQSATVKNIIPLNKANRDNILASYGNENATVRYSIPDTEYLELAKDPVKNEARLRELVDEAADKSMPETTVRQEDGQLKKVYHGRTSEFNVFDRTYANIEGDFGKGYYFSSDYYDSANNYGENGADLTNKIAREAERIEMESDGEISYEQAKEIAKEKFVTAEENVLECYLNIENPVIISDDNNGTFLDYNEEYDEEYDEYGEPEGSLIDFIEALQNQSRNYAFRSVDYSFLYDYAFEYGGIYAYDAVKVIKEKILDELFDENGDIATNEVIRAAFEEIGYDGIIDNWVSYKFQNMGLGRNTTHYIVFDSSQIKSADLVTYDDEGNIIPLSERFNEKNEDIRYSINPEFAKEIDNWYTSSRSDNEQFVLGSTGDVLQGLGARENDIYINGEKINKILDAHTEISSEEIKRIPEILDNPIIVLSSKNTVNNNSRLVMFGTVKALNGKPILCVLDLMPIENKLYVDDMQKVVSSYTKTNSPEDIKYFFENSEVLYTSKNKKITTDTLRRVGFSLPTVLLTDGYIGSITYQRRSVKLKGLPFNEVFSYDTTANNQYMQESNNNPPNSNTRYSITPEQAFDQYKSGEMSEDEYRNFLNGKTETIADIVKLTPEDASTTPPIRTTNPQVDANADSERNTYSTMLESDLYDNELKSRILTNEYIQKYKSISNKTELSIAMTKLDTNGNSYVYELLAKKPSEYNEIDTASLMILLERYQQAGRFDEAIAITEKLVALGTTAGRNVQLFSIMSRLTPEAMTRYAQKELTSAYEILVSERGKRWAEANKKKYTLTEEDIEWIRRHTIQAAMLPQDSRDQAIALGEIAAFLQDKLPVERGAGIKAYQRISMLLNIKTNVRNILGNAGMVIPFITSDFFSTPIDWLVSKRTGMRTKGIFDVKSVKGFGKGAYETWDDYKRHISTRQAELDRFEIHNGKSFNENHDGKLAKQLNDVAKVMNALDRFTSFCLEIGDRPFYEMWFMNSLNNLLRTNNVTEATPEMLELASLEALQRTWQDDNKFTAALQGLKRDLNNLSIYSYGLGDITMKFVKTPANLTKAVIDFSPVGLVNALTLEAARFTTKVKNDTLTISDQQRFVQALGNGITGTLATLIYLALAQKGYIKGGNDEDKDVANFESYILGKPAYSIKLGNTWVTYDWAQPMGTVAAAVADFVNNTRVEENTDVFNKILSAIEAGGSVLYDQSFMRGIQGLFTGTTVTDKISNVLSSEPAVYIPQFVSQTASLFDDYRRDTYDNTSILDSTINKVLVKIPGARNTLEISRDVFGNAIPNAQSSILTSYFSPFNTNTDTSDSVANEVYKVYQATGNKKALPNKSKRSITLGTKIVNGETKSIKTKLDTAEYNNFLKVEGQTAHRIIADAIETSAYKKLSDEQKVEFLKDVYAYSLALAKSKITYPYEVAHSIEKTIKEEQYEKMTDKAKRYITNERVLKGYIYKSGKLKFEKGEEAKYFLNKVK